MRKRRVGVTARSRQNVGNRETGALQFGTEMAAPLEMRTPAGTGSEGSQKSADGSMATRRAGSPPAEESSREESDWRERERGSGRGGALEARMRLCLKTPPGASP